MKLLDTLTPMLLILGGLNWGFVGLFEFNLVGTLFGEVSTATTIVYTLVGLAGLYQAVNFLKTRCSSETN